MTDPRWDKMSLKERTRKIDSIRTKKKSELGADEIKFLLWEIEWWRGNFGEAVEPEAGE